jgi:hypothetical protein
MSGAKLILQYFFLILTFWRGEFKLWKLFFQHPTILSVEEGGGGVKEGTGERGKKWPKYCMHIWIKEKKRIKYREPLSIGSSPWSVAWTFL